MNETINYAYLVGFLQSELTSLAYDSEFLKIDRNDYAGRSAYINNLIQRARNSASEYAKKVEDLSK